MSRIGIIIICGLAGSFIGLLIAGGILNQTKKSQRSAALPVAIVGGLTIGIVGGIVIASKIIDDDNSSKKYGLDKMESIEGKVGRKWVLETRWINPLSGNINSIQTGFSESSGTVMTFLNGSPHFDHESSSGSKDFIQKTHINARYELIKKIKSGELELV